MYIKVKVDHHYVVSLLYTLGPINYILACYYIWNLCHLDCYDFFPNISRKKWMNVFWRKKVDCFKDNAGKAWRQFSLCKDFLKIILFSLYLFIFIWRSLWWNTIWRKLVHTLVISLFVANSNCLKHTVLFD